MVALHCSMPTQALDKLNLTGDAATGVNILRRALEEPLRQIGHQWW